MPDCIGTVIISEDAGEEAQVSGKTCCPDVGTLTGPKQDSLTTSNGAMSLLG